MELKRSLETKIVLVDFFVNQYKEPAAFSSLTTENMREIHVEEDIQPILINLLKLNLAALPLVFNIIFSVVIESIKLGTLTNNVRKGLHSPFKYNIFCSCGFLFFFWSCATFK